MHRRRVLGPVIALFIGAVMLAVSPISFAQEANTCTATMREALTQAGVNCAGLETNSACYAFDEIESVLDSALPDDAFSERGDTISSADVITLRPEALDPLDNTWGVTALNLQANLPSGLEDNVLVVGLGGAEIEAAVPEDAAFVPLDAPIALTTSAAGELRQATLTAVGDAEVIGQVPGGTAVLADAVSEDGTWVRVIHDEQPGWLNAAAFTAADLTALPVLGDGQLTMLQSFYLRTGIDNQSCAPGISWVIVQGPQQIPVDVIINSVPIRIESTIALRTLRGGEPVGEQLQIVVLFGLAKVNPDTDDEIVIPPGYSLRVNYGPDFISAGIEGDEDERSGPTSFDQPQVLTQQELDDLNVTTLLPPDMLHYPAPPPIIVTPSGIGGPIVELIFEDPIAIVGIEELCEQGLIPVAICQVFGFAP